MAGVEIGSPAGRGPVRGWTGSPAPGVSSRGPPRLQGKQTGGPRPRTMCPMEEAQNSRRFEALVSVGAANLAAEQARAALTESVMAAREAGATWTDIGAALGVTKQTAWEKYWRDCGPTYHTA